MFTYEAAFQTAGCVTLLDQLLILNLNSPYCLTILDSGLLVVTPFCLVDGYQVFGEAYRLHFHPGSDKVEWGPI